jgi:hypothetical protein
MQKMFVRLVCLSVILMTVTIAGCSATGRPFVHVDPIPDGKGIVYVYRPDRTVGCAVSGTIRANGVPITNVKNGGYYPYVADPGRVNLNVTTEVENSTDITVEAGREKYVKTTVGMGFFLGHLKLGEVSSDVGEREIRECRLLDPM